MSGLYLTREEVDIRARLAGGQTLSTLHALVPRARNEAWLVAHAPITLDRRVEWAPVRDGEFVYIPLIPYRTHADPGRALNFAITLGLRAGLDAQLPPPREPRRLHLVTGDVADDLASSDGIKALRFYLGFAIQIH